MKILKNILRKQRDLSLDKVAGELYTSCSDLPLYNWIKLADKGDKIWLIKTGAIDSFTSDRLEEVYTAIAEEYFNLEKSSRNNRLLDLSIEIDILDKRLMLIQEVINFISLHGRREALIKLLQEDFGFDYDYIELDRDLMLTVNSAKSELIRLQQLEIEYKEIIQASEKTAWAEQDYYDEISQVSKFQNYQINTKTISVAEYVAARGMLRKHIENLNAQTNGR